MLFRQKAIVLPANAGSGANAPARQASMNDFIRMAAGRNPANRHVFGVHS